jgi:hypothetical protein
MKDTRKRVDLYGLLLLAAVFLAGGIALLMRHGTVAASGGAEPAAEYHETIGASLAHYAGGAGVFLGVALVYFYFCVRRERGRKGE